MKRKTAKQKAVDAIETIIRAAKELAKAEQVYYQQKTRKASRGASNE